MSPWFYLDPCPDSVWELLPGGREARNEVGGEVWRYVRTFVKPGRSDRFTHEFQHDSHPLYDGHVVFADVGDHDAGPRLKGLLVWHGGWDCELVDFDEFGNEVGRR